MTPDERRAHFDAIRNGTKPPDFEATAYQVFGCDLVSVPWHTEPEWTGFYNVLGRTWATCIHHSDQYLQATDHDPEAERMLTAFDHDYHADDHRRRKDPDIHTTQPTLF